MVSRHWPQIHLCTEMDFSTKINKNLKSKNIKNLKIHETIQVKHDAVQTIKHNKLRWYGHVRRMKEERHLKILLEWISKRKRKRGRPRMTWRNSVEESPNAYNLSDVIALHKEKWKGT